jgi:hypothetical protein
MRSVLVALALVAVLLVGAPDRSQCEQTMTVDVGAYGGANIPVAQDDAETGPMFGIRGRLGFPYGTIEPSVNWLMHGDGTIEDDNGTEITVEAPEITSIAINYLVRTGPVYYTAGMGWSPLNIPGGAGESDEATFNFGVGVEFPIGPISIDVCPRAFIINTAGQGSRKDAVIMAGVNYRVF